MMGGGHDLSSPIFEDDGSLLDNEYPKFSYRDANEWSIGYSSKEDEEFVDENLMMKRKIAYREIIERYDHLHGDVPRNKLCQAKNTILSYTPGSWVGNGDDKKRSGYLIPKTTTLLVIGPKGSGKSSLINRISKVFEGDKFASERAQVTFNSSSGDGTHFLQEYMIPRCSSSFCLFDTRSMSGNLAEDYEILLQWMSDGVCHGELALRDSDSSSLKIALKYKAQQCGSPSNEIRKVNFVIFVVNGLSVLRAMNGDKEEDRRYMDTVMKTFRCPYLSFRDDKPVIVFTHGDLLSLENRARIHVYLGEQLDVPPTKQIFDIPENSDSSTESSIVDMIRYSLELADKNLPLKRPRMWLEKSSLSPHGVNYQVFESTIVLASIFLAVLLGIAFVAFPVRPSHKSGESLLSSSTNWQCKSQINQLHKPCEPHMESPSYSGSNPGANQFHENQGYEYRDSHVTSKSTMTTKTYTSLEAPNSPSESVATVSKSQEPRGTSTPTMPTKLDVITSTPTLNSESVALVSEPEKLHSTAPTVPTKSKAATSPPRTTLSEDREPRRTSRPTVSPKSNAGLSTPTSSSGSDIMIASKHRKPRSSSRKKQQPTPATKWHKIRHLWAALKDQYPEPAIEWSKIRHFWAAPEDQHPEPGIH